MSKNRTRMADIASHAGVSIATVSRVFNGVGSQTTLDIEF